MFIRSEKFFNACIALDIYGVRQTFLTQNAEFTCNSQTFQCLLHTSTYECTACAPVWMGAMGTAGATTTPGAAQAKAITESTSN